MFQMIASMFEWMLVKNVSEIIVGISSMIVPNGINYRVAFTLWFFRTFGTVGTLVCLNEVLLIRYVTKVVLKRIIVMNDALVGTWIQLSNVFVTIVQIWEKLTIQLKNKSLSARQFSAQADPNGIIRKPSSRPFR